jgi:predicted nucleic-acid-binding protein
MFVLDTSALIRFLTNDIPVNAQKIKKIIESDSRLKIPDVVFPELEYVLLSKTYNATKENILKSFKFLVSKTNISVSKEVIKAVEIYEDTVLDMADCIIAANSTSDKLVTYDKRLKKIKGVKILSI